MSRYNGSNKWTKQQEDILLSLVKSGKEWKEAGENLNPKRSELAVKIRLQKIIDEFNIKGDELLDLLSCIRMTEEQYNDRSSSYCNNMNKPIDIKMASSNINIVNPVYLNEDLEKTLLNVKVDQQEKQITALEEKVDLLSQQLRQLTDIVDSFID